jgi:hypothetical protein
MRANLFGTTRIFEEPSVRQAQQFGRRLVLVLRAEGTVRGAGSQSPARPMHDQLLGRLARPVAMTAHCFGEEVLA